MANASEAVRDNYYYAPWEQLLTLLHTSSTDGLSSAEAAARLNADGPNRVHGKAGPSVWRILWRHTFNFFQVVLAAALTVSLAIGEWIDAGVVGILILINIVVGFVQEYRAEKTLQKLRELSAPKASVIRDGRGMEIPTEEIVRGDVLLLTAGDKVPADVRLFEVTELETDEALLTGESLPVEKTEHPANAPTADTPLAERSNCAFMGSACVRGTAKGVVVNTGQETELGRIAESLSKSKKEETLLQRRLNRLGIVVVIAAVVCAGIVLLTGHFWGTFDDILDDGLQTAVSTAVAIIPESLLPVLTLALTLGVRRLAKRNAIIRRLGAIESLGNITHICSDKTGTLTLGKMSAAQLRLVGQQKLLFSGEGIDPSEGALLDENGSPPPVTLALKRALQVLSLCSTATLEHEPDGRWHAQGSPTEVALLVAARRAGAAAFRRRQVRLFPFDSSVKRMSVVVVDEEEEEEEEEEGARDRAPTLLLVLMKGAPEAVLQACSVLEDGTVLSADTRRRVQEENEQVAAEGLRVLGLACGSVSSSLEADQRGVVESNLTWLGLVALADPPRESVPAAIAACHKAGIVVHMATGDQSATAQAIARSVGILPPDSPAALLATANDYDHRAENDDASPLPLVIARCTPNSKVRLINDLHRRKGYVAMTGDGVNDAPALANADVGVAMSNASDVAKEAADVVLTEDDFGVIVTAIEEGRRIFANIRKFIILYLSGNVAEVVVLVFGIAFSLDPPLEPIQILYVNLITGTPPAMALASQPFTPALMDKRLRKPGEGLWTPETIVDILVYGIAGGSCVLAVFTLMRFVFDEDLETCQATAFASLTIILALHAYNALDQRDSFLSRRLFTVKEVWVLHATVWFSIATLFLTFYVAWIRENVFHQGKPTLVGWGLTAGFAVVFLLFAELYKVAKRIVRCCRHRRSAQQRDVEFGAKEEAAAAAAAAAEAQQAAAADR